MRQMTKLAGHLPLQDMISDVIERARTKVASDESKPFPPKKDEKKAPPFAKKEEKKDEKDDGEEKKASANVIDPADPEEIEKLAAALDQAGDMLEKEADSIENGGESKQGGEQLATQSPTSGKQSYKKDGSKKHSVPMSTGMQKGDGTNGPAPTQVPNDHAKAPGGSNYPKKGVFKTAAEGVMAKIQEAAKQAPKKDEKPSDDAEEASGKKEEKKGNPFAKKDEGEKKASASPVDFILNKMAKVENGGESKQGGEQLSNTAPVPSNPGREMISSNAAVVAANKAKAKAPQKKLMSQVLTEPAQSKSTDSKVHENLRNASKGGVKIAASRVLLQKIAEAGCQCSGKGECKYCKLKAAKSKMDSGAPSQK